MAEYQLTQGVLLQRVGDEMILLEPTHGNYFTLNQTGAFMLDKLLSVKDQDQVVALTQGEFNAETSEIESDLSELIKQLLEQDLITIV